MAYRKFRADRLFTGATLLDNDLVLITSEEGVVEAIVPAADAGGDIEQFEGWLSPGFVNCHCHLELSYLKDRIPEHTGLVDFLLSVMRQRGAPAGMVQDAIMIAEEEMLQNGIVAVGDICNTADTVAQKMEGRLFYHNFIEVAGFSEETAQARFDAGRQVFSAFAQVYPIPIQSNSIVPHAPYSVAPKLFDLIARFPGNQLLTIHNQEDEAENEFFREGRGALQRLYEGLGIDSSRFEATGRNSLPHFLPHFYKSQTLILVHNVATGEEDLAFLRDRPAASLFFCLCPNANLYIGGKLPRLDLLLRQDARMVIGTDSLASNHRLSILEELKTLQKNFPFLPAATLLEWATKNGAEALHMDGVLGSFEPGLQPSVILIEGMEDGRFGAESQVRRLI